MNKILLYLLLLIPIAVYSQQDINIGSSANDGTGDNLRTAFQKTNTNFDNVFDTANNNYSAIEKLNDTITEHRTDIDSKATQVALSEGLGYKTDTSDFNAHRDSTEKHYLQSEISITASQVSDFDTEVSNNTNVQANTDSNHWHDNKSVIDRITSAFTTADSTKLDGIEVGAEVNTINPGDNVSELVNDAGYLTVEVDGSVTNEIQVLSISNDTIYLSDGGFVKLPASSGGDIDTTYIYQAIASKADTVEWDTSLTTTEDTLLLIVYSRDLDKRDTIKIAKGSLPSSSSDSALYANNAYSLGGLPASSYLTNSGDTASDLVVTGDLKFGGAFTNKIYTDETTDDLIFKAENTGYLFFDISANNIVPQQAIVNTATGQIYMKYLKVPTSNSIGSTGGRFTLDGSTGSLMHLWADNSHNAYLGKESGNTFKYYADEDSASVGDLTATGKVTANSFGSTFISETYSASKTVDMSTGQKHKMTVTGDMTINFTNIVEGVVYEFWFTQDGTGGHTVTPGTWNGGTATPFANTGSFNDTASKTASKTTVLQFQSNGSIILYGITTN